MKKYQTAFYVGASVMLLTFMVMHILGLGFIGNAILITLVMALGSEITERWLS